MVASSKATRPGDYSIDTLMSRRNKSTVYADLKVLASGESTTKSRQVRGVSRTSRVAHERSYTKPDGMNQVAASDGFLHVGRPNIGDRSRLIARINDILDRRWLTNHGPYVREFEDRIEEELGVRHCIGVCNGTIGLELAIRALDLEGEVILPSFTFVATAHALRWHGITPVFCDINPETYTIDPDEVRQLITPETSAILGVHLWGHSCEVDQLQELANRFNLKLLFDAAHAFGCSYQGQMIGGFGDAEVFSFHATKYLNAFEGGAITTNSDELAERIRRLHNFGYNAENDVEHVGVNGKMTEVSAAMGITSLESMDEFIDVNYRHYRTYESELQNVPGITLIPYDDREARNYQYVVIKVDEEVAGISRDRLQLELQRHNVLARRYFQPGCHQVEPYKSECPEAANRLTNSESLSGSVLALPTGTSVATEDIKMICAVIKDALR